MLMNIYFYISAYIYLGTTPIGVQKLTSDCAKSTAWKIIYGAVNQTKVVWLKVSCLHLSSNFPILTSHILKKSALFNCHQYLGK